jgi:hypothetical protein
MMNLFLNLTNLEMETLFLLEEEIFVMTTHLVRNQIPTHFQTEKSLFTGSSGFTKEFQDIMTKDSNEIHTQEVSKKLFGTINLKDVERMEEKKEVKMVQKDFRRHSSAVDMIHKKEIPQTSPTKTPPKSSQPKTPTSCLKKSGKRKSVSFARKMERPHIFNKNEKPSLIKRDHSPRTPEILESMIPAPTVTEIPLKKVEHFKEIQEEVDVKNVSSISNLSPIPRSEDSFCAPYDEPSIDFSHTVRICKVQEPIIEIKEKEKVVEVKENIYDCNPFTPSLKRDKPSTTPAIKNISPVSEIAKPLTPSVDKYSHTVAKELFIDFDLKEFPEDVMECDEEEEIGSPDLGAMEEDEIIIDEQLIDYEEPKNIISQIEPTKEHEELLEEPKPSTPVKSTNISLHSSLEKVARFTPTKVDEVEISPPTKSKRKSMDKLIVEPPKVSQAVPPEPILEKKTTPVKSRSSSNQFRKIQEQSPQRSPALDYEIENFKSSPTDIIPDFTALMTKASPNPYQNSPYKSKEKNNFEFDATEELESQVKKKINFDDEHQKEKKIQEKVEKIQEEKVEKMEEQKTKIKTRRRKETTEKVESEKPCNNENVAEENTKTVEAPKTINALSGTTIVKTRKGKKTEVKSSEILQEKQGTTIVKTRKNRVKK